MLVSGPLWPSISGAEAATHRRHRMTDGFRALSRVRQRPEKNWTQITFRLGNRSNPVDDPVREMSHVAGDKRHGVHRDEPCRERGARWPEGPTTNASLTP